MTINEAIVYLEDPIGKREQHDEAIKMAISALKKQIPKRPQVMEFYVTLNGDIRKMRMCGECNAYVSDQSSYCWNCGQAIGAESE